MNLAITTAGNKHVIVFQDYFTKWPIVCPLPDQKAHRIARVLVDEVIPLFTFGMGHSIIAQGDPLSGFKTSCKALKNRLDQMESPVQRSLTMETMVLHRMTQLLIRIMLNLIPKVMPIRMLELKRVARQRE